MKRKYTSNEIGDAMVALFVGIGAAMVLGIELGELGLRAAEWIVGR